MRALRPRAFDPMLRADRQTITALVIRAPAGVPLLGGLDDARVPWRFRTEAAASLAEGLVRLTAGGVDVVLLDAAMPDAPDLSGLRVISDCVPDVPVVLLLGDQAAAGRLGVQAIRLGAQDYLVAERVDEEVAAWTLGHAVERHRAAQGLRGFSHYLESRVARRTQALEEANRELEAFTYSVSHDLRSPLCTINGLAELLLVDHGSTLEPDARACIERIVRAGTSMESLIQALLDLSRAKETVLRRRQVNLSALVRDTVDDLGSREPERAVDVIVEEDVHALGDPALLKLVVDNLIGNAWKFSSSQPKTRIEFGRVEIEGQTVYRVRDDGPGFDAGDANRLFEPFQRLDGRVDGLGVGLATVDRVVKRHEGRVWAESRPGHGATFYFTLGRRRRVAKRP